MSLEICEVLDDFDRSRFINFPWHIYSKDCYWVPPIRKERRNRLDAAKNPFWNSAEYKSWLAFRDGKIVGTIAGIIDRHRNQTLGRATGNFGFFECLDDPPAAGLLLETVCDWLRTQGMTRVEGPLNPSEMDEPGILVEGITTRPAIMEGHNPPYYVKLLEQAGFSAGSESVARLAYTPPKGQDFRQALPEKLVRVADRVRQRDDFLVRQVNLADWENEILMACHIYNRALGELKDYLPIPAANFLAIANGFKPIIVPDMALLAEIGGEPVGFALALPDFYEIQQKINGNMGPLELLKILWYRRHVTRVSFKILMVIPEFLHRGVEAALIYDIARAICMHGYKEVDMSLTGLDNWKSNHFQENLGFNIYRRYRLYNKELE